MSQVDPIVVVGAARTPMGGFQGALKDVRAPELGARAIAGALARAGLAAGDVDEVVMGCVLPSGNTIVAAVPPGKSSVACRAPSASLTTLPRATCIGRLAVKSTVVTCPSNGMSTTSAANA